MRLKVKLGLFGLTAAVLISGCLSSAPGENSIAPQPTPPTIPHALVFEEGVVAGSFDNAQQEAFVAVSPDGRTVLTCAHGSFKRASFMFASTDGGATWNVLKADPDPRVGGDCEVALSADGAWTFLHSTVAGATVATTKDQGKTWLVNPAAAAPVGGMADRPWIAYAGNRLLLTFMPYPGQPGTIGFTRSDDYGATWTPPQWIVPPDPQGPNVIQGPFVIAPDGKTVRVPLAHGVTLAQVATKVPARLSFAVSRDNGATWKEETVGTFPDAAMQNPTGVAQDAAGTLHWVFPQFVGGFFEDEDFWLIQSSDDGKTWTEPMLLEEKASYPRPWARGRQIGFDLLFQNDGGGLTFERVYPNGTVEASVHLLDLQDTVEFAGFALDASGRAFVAVTDGGPTAPKVLMFREAPGAARP